MKRGTVEESSQTFGHLLLPLPPPPWLWQPSFHLAFTRLPAHILWGLFTHVLYSHIYKYSCHIYIQTEASFSHGVVQIISQTFAPLKVARWFFFLRCTSMKCIGLNLFELTALYVPWGISQDDDSFGQSALYLSTLFCLWSVLRPPPGIFADSPTSCWIF